MPVGMRDERLCWTIVHDRLMRRAGRYGFLGWLGVFLTLGLTIHRHRSVQGNRMVVYSIAVEQAAARLTDEERIVLRAERRVPPWFLAEVDRRYKLAKRG